MISGQTGSARKISREGGGLALARAIVVAAVVVAPIIGIALGTPLSDPAVAMSVIAAGIAYFALPLVARRYLALPLPAWVPRSAPPLAAVDCLSWLAAVWVAHLVVREFGSVSHGPAYVAATGTTLAAVQLVSGGVVGTYRGRWRVGSFGEAVGVLYAALLSLAAYSAFMAVADTSRHDATWRLVALLLAISTMLLPRMAWRFARERRSASSSTVRVLVYGAGQGAAAIIPSLLDRNSGLEPVGIIDDDPAKRYRTIDGIRVVGTGNRLREVAARFEVEAVLIAIPSATSELIRSIVHEVESCDLKPLIMPRPAELLGGAGDVREVSEEDLLGRREYETDLSSMAHYITGRRVLVTGAGGSIGSELARQLYALAPARLVLLDRDESALHGTLLSMTGRALLGDDSTVLCDIRDAGACDRAFQELRPEVVFHAAALKHVPMLERFPDEAYKTNVLGTRNVLRAAERAGVDRFVNISTDKAADPVNILGLSKRVTERLTSSWARRTGRPWVSVRFGNVLGSRGSMLITFRSQVSQGGPVTVTHPDATRYFMTIEEAVALTIQAGAIGSASQVLVLDMGEPIRINDVAELLIARSKRPIQIEYTGLRVGEKMHEELFGTDEIACESSHPAIAQAVVPPIDEADIAVLDDIDGPFWRSDTAMTRLATSVEIFSPTGPAVAPGSPTPAMMS